MTPGWIARQSFHTCRVGRVGAELEWIVFDPRSPDRRPDPGWVAGAVEGPLPCGGVISFEPGGQLELSSLPADSVAECLGALRLDRAELLGRVDRAGLAVSELALDSRTPQRVVDHPRYRALDAHYARFGDAGLRIMCNAASTQVNVEAGDSSTGWRGIDRRWRLANLLGPVFVAMFANSPGSGWRSRREMLRLQCEPSRILPIEVTGDARADWERAVLDAFVVGVPPEDPDGQWAPAPLAERMRSRLRRGEVTEHQLAIHLKTVIPPVRACGHLELRMIDAQPGRFWMVPIAVAAALIDDPIAAGEALEVVDTGAPVYRDWTLAAMLGVAEPGLGERARACLGIARRALDRLRAPGWVAEAVDEFAATRVTDP